MSSIRFSYGAIFPNQYKNSTLKLSLSKCNLQWQFEIK